MVPLLCYSLFQIWIWIWIWIWIRFWFWFRIQVQIHFLVLVFVPPPLNTLKEGMKKGKKIKKGERKRRKNVISEYAPETIHTEISFSY